MISRIIFAAVGVLVLAACEDKPQHAAPKDPAVSVPAVAETAPVADREDAADDPAIWVDRNDSSRSVIIGTNKKRGLGVYALDGRLLTSRDDGRMNNVDLRQGVAIGGQTLDIVAATNRTDQTLAIYKFDGETRALSPLLPPVATGFVDPYGLCLYVNAKTGALFIIATDKGGTVAQWSLTSSDGTTFAAEKLRSFMVGSQAEGCVADDANGILFITEEDVGFYAYNAGPEFGSGARNGRVMIDKVANGHLTADVEGIALVDEGDGRGYLVVSSQGSYSYNVYDRVEPYAFRGAFVVAGADAIDGAEETDGLDATAANLGGAFEGGLFVAQDGFNYEGLDGKRANQNFKLVPWASIRAALKLPDATPQN